MFWILVLVVILVYCFYKSKNSPYKPPKYIIKEYRSNGGSIHYRVSYKVNLLNTKHLDWRGLGWYIYEWGSDIPTYDLVQGAIAAHKVVHYQEWLYKPAKVKRIKEG